MTLDAVTLRDLEVLTFSVLSKRNVYVYVDQYSFVVWCPFFSECAASTPFRTELQGANTERLVAAMVSAFAAVCFERLKCEVID